MRAILPIPRSRRPHPAILPGVLLLGLAPLFVVPANAELGQWSPATDWTHGNHERYAVHMALLPGDGASAHSKILWWHDEKLGVFRGGLWRWKPGNDGCAAFPGASFDSLPVPSAGVDFFCAGQTALPDGRLMVMGGTDPVTTTYGELRARVFAPGTCAAPAAWSDPGSMVWPRWYPSSTVLRDGRVLVTSGSTPPPERLFGGLRDGLPPASPAADSLYLFTAVAGGRWGPSMVPAGAQRPTPRAGHSAVDMNGVVGFFGQVYFGGRKADGTALDETWLLTLKPNPLGSDFYMEWGKVSGFTTLAASRSEHSSVGAALDQMMMVYGGLDSASVPLGDAWRLYPDDQGYLHWRRITTLALDAPPSARYGHAAVYDVTTRASGNPPETLKRMIVFGGAGSGGTPNDTRVWELRFDHTTADTATWRELPLAERPGDRPLPGPRFWHRMVMDPLPHGDPFTGASGHAALMYGGALGGNAYSDSLWTLWVFADSVWWDHRSVTSPGGQAPGARARYSASFDPGHGEGVNGGRLFIYGGECQGGVTDRFVYAVDPFATDPAWIKWSDPGFTLSGHTALPDGSGLVRIPELFDPTSGHWQDPLTGSPLRQQFYPPTFLVPGGGHGASRLVSVAYDTTYWLDVPESGTAGAWQRLTNGTLDFNPQTGVAYRPGRLMLAGGGDNAAQVTGSTVTFDASDLSHPWVASGDMLPREDHDLVLLPNGKVLVLGGLSGYVEGNSDAVRAAAVHWPQVWDPAANGGAGAWSSTDNPSTRLAWQPSVREDHSTTILLPDGRILSASGEFTTARDSAEVFCPPYLFKSDGVTLATRPVIRDAPPCIGWGGSFTVSVADADTAHIQSVCLIRPGAITHAVDQNQRFVPVSFTAHGNPPRLAVTAPASPDSAPPGYYLLFVLGSSDGAEVPSIARWIRIVDNDMSSGPDQGPPATLTDFAVDAVSQNSVYLTWTATADDGTDPDSGPACEFDLRKASSAINTEAKWDVAIPLCGEPVPGPVGTAHDYLVSGLAACTWYDFALRAKDEELNLSGLHDRVFARTLGCGGGGGGGYAARAVQGDAAFRATSGALIAESDRNAAGGWQLTLRAVGSIEGLEGAATDGISIQERTATGMWRTLSRFRLGESEDALGLCALRERGRAIVAGDFGLQQVAGAFTAEGTTYGLAAAAHSGLDSVDVATLAAGGAVSLAVGDTLTLRYAPTSAPDSTAAGWYLLAGRGLLVSATRQRRAAERGAVLPVRFALHPNAPNPLTTTTTIRFDLPVGAMVRLEVFDVAGRRVSVLANHYFPPGYHELEWGRRTPSGLAASAGVYFYRLEAGPWRDRKKMVLLP